MNFAASSAVCDKRSRCDGFLMSRMDTAWSTRDVHGTNVPTAVCFSVKDVLSGA